ncbi:hypothetical protein [Candidatus Cytomitobacter primus]|uniref:Uncharacterized protein n=1 Tax=Candidatus Cytomitobacter primus TaxID=2066024 RepID=A0A5C0UGM1_9PROT|nr:hypothetical protein [Candidatus Cytomitobacter primus]QEK38442.1 hypothetical protein FZC34_00720 [Candidatus Cytomitobacter primus]
MRKRVNTICNNVHLSLGSIIMATKHIGYYIESNIHNQKREIIQKNTPTNIAFLKSFICISHGLFLKHNIKHNLFIYTKLSLSFKKYEMKVLKGYDHNNISNSAFCTNGFGAALGVHYKKNRKCGIFWEVQMKKFIPLEWDREENSRITPPKEFSTSIGFIVNMLKKHN